MLRLSFSIAFGVGRIVWNGKAQDTLGALAEPNKAKQT